MLEGENTIAEAVPNTPAPSEPTTETQPDPYEGMIDLDNPVEIEPAAQEETAEPEPGAEAEPTEGDGQPEEPAYATIEIDGKQYNVPEELKEGYMRTADYTRKTQEVAEQRRIVEAQRAETEAMFNISTEFVDGRAKLANADAMLQQYSQVDWDAYFNEDPIGAPNDWRKFQSLQQERAQIAQNLSVAWNQRSEQQRIDTDKRIQETLDFAAKSIPGWTTEVDQKLGEFALEQGFSRDYLRSNLDPKIYKMLHLAWVGSQTLNRTQSAPKPQSQTTPLKTVSAKASPNIRRDPADLPMSEFVKARAHIK
jgi:hypothetical protein